MFKRILSDNRSVEIIPLLIIISLLPFLQGGESLLSKAIFLGFPLFYLPILFRRKRKVTHSFRPIFLAWSAFLSVALISMLFSISRSFSLPSFFGLSGVFIYFVLFSLVVEARTGLKLFSYSIIIVALILSFISLFFIISPPTSMSGMNLVYASFGHNHLSDYLIFTLPLSVVLFLRQTKTIPNFLTCLLVVFFFINFFLTFARTAFLIVSFMIFGLVWIYKPVMKKAVFLLTLASIPLLMSLAIVFISNSQIRGRFNLSTSSRSEWLIRQAIKPIANEGRFEYWKQAMQGFRERPLLGNGPGTFRLISQRFRQQSSVFSWFTHNFFLQTAAEVGVLGFGTFSLLLFLVFKNMHIPHLRNQADYPVALFMGVLGSLLQSFFDFNFNFLAIFLLFWVSVAFLLHTPRDRHMVSPPRMLPLSMTVVSFLSLGLVITTLFGRFLLLRGDQSNFSSIGKAPFSVTFSVLLPSLDHERFQILIRSSTSGHKDFHDPLFEKALVFWNKEDPNFSLWLANLTDPSPESNQYYVQAVRFSSAFDKIHLIGRLLEIEGGDDDFVVETFLSILTQSEFPHLKDRLQEIPSSHRQILLTYIKQHYSPDILDIPPMRWWASKVFYFTGLELFEQGEQEQTALFWDWARLISPDWDYFQIEAAAYQYYILNDPNQARAILKECLSNEYAKESCLNQLRSGVALLPEPGSYRDRIAEIAYK